MVKTIIISICTSLVVSLITFILGLKAGKNQADRDKLQTIYKKMYSHFQDILKGMNEGRHREWSDYKEKKSLYKTEYYPLVKELKSNGELLFIDKNIAEKAEKLERDCLNFAYSVNQTISDIHNVIALNPEYYVGGIKFPNHVKNDSKSHICTVNKDNCNRYRYQSYCSFFSKIELTEILHEWKATTDSYVIDFNTRGNPASGSQGVAFEEDSGKYVVKIYYTAENQVLNEAALEKISFLEGIELPPNFVSIVDVITNPCIGYVMERVVGYKPLNKYLIQPKDEGFSAWYNSGYGFRERLFIGYVIAKAFSEMEVRNLSYCDISGNNILTKVAKGIAVKMIDIDNIYIAGKGNATIIGTPRYIAPEVIARTHNPDILSDNYSLAVILFELLRVGHPYVSDEVLAGTFVSFP